jgi:hypothetical protein
MTNKNSSNGVSSTKA